MILACWQIDNLKTDAARIYPDGCRDVIWYRFPGQAPRWKLSSLDTARRCLTGASGAALAGFRLAPGCVVDEAALLAELDPEKPDACEAIPAHAALPQDVAELMLAFRDTPALAMGRVAARLGCSLRSLQRHCLQRTGQPPIFWRRLIRLRQALTDAREGLPLAEAAVGSGFADQAHFTREARQFHGAPPGRLLADAEAMGLILAPGL